MTGMQAAVRERYGSPDVVEIRDVERPTPGGRPDMVRLSKFRVDRMRGRSGNRSRNLKRSRSTTFGTATAFNPNDLNTSTRKREGTIERSTRAMAARAIAERFKWSGASPLR